jgi:hypothetical protein
MAPMRARLGLIAVACGCLGGCLDTLTESILAPESVAMQGVAGSVNAVSGGDASELSSELSGAMGSTAAQLDDILAAYPSAINRPELSALRSQLGQASPAEKNEPGDGSWAQEPEQAAQFDHRVRLGPENTRHQGDVLSLARLGNPRRIGHQLPAPTEPTWLDRWNPQPYVINPLAVRVR